MLIDFSKGIVKSASDIIGSSTWVNPNYKPNPESEQSQIHLSTIWNNKNGSNPIKRYSKTIVLVALLVLLGIYLHTNPQIVSSVSSLFSDLGNVASNAASTQTTNPPGSYFQTITTTTLSVTTTTLDPYASYSQMVSQQFVQNCSEQAEIISEMKYTGVWVNGSTSQMFVISDSSGNIPLVNYPPIDKPDGQMDATGNTEYAFFGTPIPHNDSDNRCWMNIQKIELLGNALTTNSPTAQPVQVNSVVTNGNQETETFNYVLRGSSGSISLSLDSQTESYLAGLPRTYTCDPTCPTQDQIEINDINEPTEQPTIQQLVQSIQSKTSSTDDQARIAISLVQNIPYDWSGFVSGNLNGRYPFQVLYENTGVCEEKSHLLADILQDLGYGVVLFKFDPSSTSQVNHEAIGIECQQQYSYENSGYCFVEATTPTIITYDNGQYSVSPTQTEPLPPSSDTVQISNGKSFDASQEYADAQLYNQINQKSESQNHILDTATYNEWVTLVNKYGLQVTKSS